MLYLKNDQVVEATQWQPGINHPAVREKTSWLGTDKQTYGVFEDAEGGLNMVQPGDWVVTEGTKTSVYKPDEFETLFKPTSK